MNKRMEDLLYQAGLTASGCWDELGTYEQEAIEKFSELIVRECAGLMDGRRIEYGNCKDGRVILKHFGVEE